MFQVGINTIYYHILVIGDHLATIGGVQFQVLHLGHFLGWTSLTWLSLVCRGTVIIECPLLRFLETVIEQFNKEKEWNQNYFQDFTAPLNSTIAISAASTMIFEPFLFVLLCFVSRLPFLNTTRQNVTIYWHMINF